MGWKDQYWNAKKKLLADETVCLENRKLFDRFFEFEEYKLKRRNRLSELDDGCYKTLYDYTQRFRRVNTWFENRPWADLTKEDIKRVYDALEDGKIMTQRGTPVQNRRSYYNKVFKSKPFQLAGKRELAREVIEFPPFERKEVRYLTEEVFRQMADMLSKPHHRLLFWLAWDIGENIDALLKLTKGDFIKQQNQGSGTEEYLVRLGQDKIKRSRLSRTEPALYDETNRYLGIVLAPINAGDRVFQFGYRQSVKLLHTVASKVHATTMPSDQSVRWKDFRSGMACHLLKSGWTTDEVNARLGQTVRVSVEEVRRLPCCRCWSCRQAPSSHRLDYRQSTIPRTSLCHLSREARRALHQSWLSARGPCLRSFLRHWDDLGSREALRTTLSRNRP